MNNHKSCSLAKKLKVFFQIHSGDFHAVKELDPGKIPLISCGNNNNGLIGYFDIPEEKIYSHVITVAYNGQPLTAKFHPYKFGAKDDVAVLIPKVPMSDTAMLFIAALLNSNRWKYSYGRKCFREKLQNFELLVPITEVHGETQLDEETILRLFPKEYIKYLPQKINKLSISIPEIQWHEFSILELFNLERGDFHSIAKLDSGDILTVSRVSENNGVVGYFKKPENASIYDKGHITISTVGGDAFVQLDDFIVTDNVIICLPKNKYRLTTLFFIVFMLNYQKWRYSYGRQCYKAKLEKVKIYLPIDKNGYLDENCIETIVKQTSYWPNIEKWFEEHS
ncbi:MAG TPA: restriction endonuclease subunit S [Ktedonobacteraceae bacterium]|nr:restriction endonuclease subunit S [Ktedonobacteraceae bacterium]